MIKCGACGSATVEVDVMVQPKPGSDIWTFETRHHCQRCGFEATAEGHFARRLERVERAAVAIQATLCGSPQAGGVVAALSISRAESETDTIVAIAAEQIEALDRWAEGRAG